MKTLKLTCATLILVLSLNIPTFAEDTNPGEVHTPGRSSSVTGGTADSKDNETGTADAETGYSVLADIVWAVASIF